MNKKYNFYEKILRKYLDKMSDENYLTRLNTIEFLIYTLATLGLLIPYLVFDYLKKEIIKNKCENLMRLLFAMLSLIPLYAAASSLWWFTTYWTLIYKQLSPEFILSLFLILFYGSYKLFGWIWMSFVEKEDD